MNETYSYFGRVEYGVITSQSTTQRSLTQEERVFQYKCSDDIAKYLGLHESSTQVATSSLGVLKLETGRRFDTIEDAINITVHPGLSSVEQTLERLSESSLRDSWQL